MFISVGCESEEIPHPETIKSMKQDYEIKMNNLKDEMECLVKYVATYGKALYDKQEKLESCKQSLNTLEFLQEKVENE